MKLRKIIQWIFRNPYKELFLQNRNNQLKEFFFNNETFFYIIQEIDRGDVSVVATTFYKYNTNTNSYLRVFEIYKDIESEIYSKELVRNDIQEEYNYYKLKLEREKEISLGHII